VIGRRLGIRTVAAFVDRANVVALVDETEVVDARGLDVLVIDVDGNDWYLWRELAHRYRPSLVVTEVNGALGPWIDWVMPYDPEHEWHDDRNHGATLRAWNRLAREFGYVLVACDGNGVNAFWVRRDHAANFPAAGRVLRQYAPPAHDPPLGHPWFAPPPPANTALTLDELARIRLERPTFARARRAGRANAVIVDIVNGSPHPIASIGANPVKITARWGTNPSSTEWTEPQRGLIAGTIAPGERGAGVVMLGAQTESFATLDVVQEGVAWAHDAPAWEPVRAE
jgi:hypothetical protein